MNHNEQRHGHSHARTPNSHHLASHTVRFHTNKSNRRENDAYFFCSLDKYNLDIYLLAHIDSDKHATEQNETTFAEDFFLGSVCGRDAAFNARSNE